MSSRRPLTWRHAALLAQIFDPSRVPALLYTDTSTSVAAESQHTPSAGGAQVARPGLVTDNGGVCGRFTLTVSSRVLAEVFQCRFPEVSPR